MNYCLYYNFKFENDQALAVIDTGTSMLAFPKVYYNIVVQRWKEQISNPDHIDC
jgi:hypothetical protein